MLFRNINVLWETGLALPKPLLGAISNLFLHLVVKSRCGKIICTVQYMCTVSNRVLFDVSNIVKNIFPNKLGKTSLLVFSSMESNSDNDLFISRVNGAIYSLKLVFGYRTLVHIRCEWI